MFNFFMDDIYDENNTTQHGTRHTIHSPQHRRRHLLLCLEDNSLKEIYNLENKWRDSGVDLHFPSVVECPPRTTTKVSLGVSAAVCEDGGENSHPYYLYPRSSISKTPLRLANSVGIIDSQYRGNLCVVLDNISDEPYTIEKGVRLFQLCAQDLEPFHSIKFVESLESTGRGKNGFGSTGNN
jgi:dUTP pyrophosphatase